MSPTVLRLEGYRFFFNSREETRRHVHVATADGMAKFSLEPKVAIASAYNLSGRQLRKIEELVLENEDEFTRAWDEHFRQ